MKLTHHKDGKVSIVCNDDLEARSLLSNAACGALNNAKIEDDGLLAKNYRKLAAEYLEHWDTIFSKKEAKS